MHACAGIYSRENILVRVYVRAYLSGVVMYMTHIFCTY